MCRFTFYMGKPIVLSSLITEPRHSLIHQSFASRERDEPLNGDGFGLAWYNHSLSNQPALFKSVSPAWSNNNLQEICSNIKSTCIMAHVRAATQSRIVSESNCHPFKWEQFTFMHNGDVGGFSRIKRALLGMLSDDAFNHIKGTTDSEHFFALLIDELHQLGGLEPHDRLATGMIKTIRKVTALTKEYAPDEHSYLNFVISDGHLALAVRYTTDLPEHADSLYLNIGKSYHCEGGVCYMKEPGDHEKSVIISSEPLSKDPGWEKIPVNSMILVNEGHVLDRIEINPGF
ncbi:MAG: class II glutamine amidotransferase [Bacteroidota bacterium]